MEYLYKTGKVADENAVIGKKVRVHTDIVDGEQRISYITKTGWRDLNKYLACYRSKKEETFRYLLLNVTGQIVHQLTICSHLPNFCRVSEENDKTLKEVITKMEAENLYLVVTHNHPSGNTEPSSLDRELTESIARSLKRNDGKQSFIGHIIPDENQYDYCNNNCRWHREKLDTLCVRDIRPNKWWSGYIGGTSALIAMGNKSLGSSISIVFSNADREVVARKLVPTEWISKSVEKIRDSLVKTAKKVGAIGAFMIVPEKANADELTLKNLVENDAITDAYMKGRSITEKFDLDAGASFYQLFNKLSEKDKLDVRSTWVTSINKRLFPDD